MQKNEKINENQQDAGKNSEAFFCGMKDFRPMRDCCGNEGESDCCSMMGKQIGMCRWFPLVPIVFGAGLLLAGYYLDAEITRVLWMVVSGCLVMLGFFCFIAARRMKNICCG